MVIRFGSSSISLRGDWSDSAHHKSLYQLKQQHLLKERAKTAPTTSPSIESQVTLLPHNLLTSHNIFTRVQNAAFGNILALQKLLVDTAHAYDQKLGE